MSSIYWLKNNPNFKKVRNVENLDIPITNSKIRKIVENIGAWEDDVLVIKMIEERRDDIETLIRSTDAEIKHLLATFEELEFDFEDLLLPVFHAVRAS